MLAQHFVVYVIWQEMVLLQEMVLVMIQELLMVRVTRMVKALVKVTSLVKDSVKILNCYVLPHNHWVVVDCTV